MPAYLQIFATFCVFLTYHYPYAILPNLFFHILRISDGMKPVMGSILIYNNFFPGTGYVKGWFYLYPILRLSDPLF